MREWCQLAFEESPADMLEEEEQLDDFVKPDSFRDKHTLRIPLTGSSVTFNILCLPVLEASDCEPCTDDSAHLWLRGGRG